MTMGWRRVGTQPPHTSSLPVSLCSSLPLFLLPARHYKNVLSALDAYLKLQPQLDPHPKEKQKSEKEQPKKNGTWGWGLAKEERVREKGRERDKEVIG